MKAEELGALARLLEALLEVLPDPHEAAWRATPCAVAATPCPTGGRPPNLSGLPPVSRTSR